MKGATQVPQHAMAGVSVVAKASLPTFVEEEQVQIVYDWSLL